METTGSARFRRLQYNERGRIRAGTTFRQMRRPGSGCCRPLCFDLTGECWTGVHGDAGSNPAPGVTPGILSPILVAGARIDPAANAGGTTFNLQVPGSNPGLASTGGIAQIG